MRNPRRFGGGLRSFDGGEWQVGGDRWRDNPRLVIPAAFFHCVRLWLRCRGDGGGLANLPEAGGINAQPTWLLAAFDTLAAADAEARETQGAG